MGSGAYGLENKSIKKALYKKNQQIGRTLKSSIFKWNKRDQILNFQKEIISLASQAVYEIPCG